jgi:phage terminase large subunit GpA-like protein
MNEIILRTTAIKITNKGGGVQRRIDRKEGVAKSSTDTGSDYVTFVCPYPKCGHRNKLCMYQAENYVPANEDRIPFRCKMCRHIIEVERPHVPTKLILDPAEFTKEMAHRRKDLAEHRRIMGRS